MLPKSMYRKPRAKLILTCQKKSAFQLILRIRQGCQVELLLLNIVLKVLNSTRRGERLPDWKERSKTLFTGNIIIYVESPKVAMIRPLQLIEEFSHKLKINMQKTVFLYNCMQNSENEIRKQFYSLVTLKMNT